MSLTPSIGCFPPRIQISIPLTDKPVFTEEDLDAKFKPEAIWKTTYLKTQDPKHPRNGEEILAKFGELKDGVLKIKAQWEKPGHDGFPQTRIPLLTYVSAKELESYLNMHNQDALSAVTFFTNVAVHEDRSFYHCENCNGYVSGRLNEDEYNDMKMLAGTCGTNYKCNRCGTTLATLIIGYS
jgi:hypothetical protein